MSDKTDRELGMNRRITRRDSLNGTGRDYGCCNHAVGSYSTAI
ncbi:MAG: hypothetical protein WBV55_15205 [Candidatus Sulfotelmatobacter sp.]